MLFQTSQEHQQLRAQIREWAEKEIKPIAFSLDKNNEFPKKQIRDFGKMGFMGIPYPKEYGGAGKDILSYAIAVEELSRVDGGTGVILSAHVSLGAYPIYAYGTQEQKEKYLIPLAKGEKIGAFGLTEPNAGSDAGGTETTAELVGDHYILNGEKIFITNGGEADTYVIFAVTTPGIGTKGISAFIVEKGWEGFTFGDHYDKMGIRSSATCQLLFSDVKIPKENLLGKEGQGFKIAEMATKIRAARFLVYSAAELKENHQPYGMESAMAKKYASDICLQVVNDALQTFGGNGYLKGMEVERFYRDAKICTIYEGTNEIQNVVIASHILGKAAKAAPAAKTAVKKLPVTGARKKMIFKDGSPAEKATALAEALKADGYDFSVGIDIDTPIIEAERVVSAGKGVGSKENMKLIEKLAKAAGAAVGSSRPVAEQLMYVPLNRYVGMSGQKFTGNLYIACGISGASQHLKGIKDASTIVAINTNANAPIFKNADYGVVGDLNEIIPELIKALGGDSPKKPAPPMVKMKRQVPEEPSPAPVGRYVCLGCGYEYIPELGDEEGEVAPGTRFKDIPQEWTCPECGEEKSNFIPSSEEV